MYVCITQGEKQKQGEEGEQDDEQGGGGGDAQCSSFNLRHG